MWTMTSFACLFYYWYRHHLLQGVFPVISNLHLSLLVPQYFADLDDLLTVVMNCLPWLYTSRRCNNNIKDLQSKERLRDFHRFNDLSS